MKRTTSMTIAALLVAVATGSAIAPASAQEHRERPDLRDRGHGVQMPDGAPNGFWIHKDRGDGRSHMALRGDRRGGSGGNMLDLVCSPRGADRLEHLLQTIAQRVDPTAEQQPLFDELRTIALTAQTSYADTCAASLPARGADAPRPDLLERLKVSHELEKAHVEAMVTVIPAFETFYASLTDAQKRQLEPRQRRMQGRGIEAPASPAPTPGAEPKAN